MISILSISIAVLVAFNFLLLKFSCNKTTSIQKDIKRPIVLSERITSESDSHQLAPTGS